jgi:hypothetical protein
MLKINTVTMEDKIEKILKNSYSNFGEFDESKAAKELLNLFSVKRSYEFYLFSGNQIMVNRDVKELQKQGWELAGDVKPFTGNHGYKGMLIPLKRKI